MDNNRWMDFTEVCGLNSAVYASLGGLGWAMSHPLGRNLISEESKPTKALQAPGVNAVLSTIFKSQCPPCFRNIFQMVSGGSNLVHGVCPSWLAPQWLSRILQNLRGKHVTPLGCVGKSVWDCGIAISLSCASCTPIPSVSDLCYLVESISVQTGDSNSSRLQQGIGFVG
uniref:Uncharacterized protein n=1 Tax=Eutreptiella gymnastica TaxID=73025 RepID=A0A7S1JG29_9EUGL